jgi:predicted transcriptional regulator
LTDGQKRERVKRELPTSGLGYNIRVKRAKLGLSQAELAKRVGLSQSALSRIEKHVSDPRLSHVERIAEMLGLDLDKIISENNS